jgi:tol-pal system protein YbgF
MVKMRSNAQGQGALARRARLAAIGLIVALPLAGCATKKDMKLLRDEVIMLQLRQDSLFRAAQTENQRQTQLVMDTLRLAFMTGQQNVGGELSHQIRQIIDQQSELAVLVGQQQQQLGQLRDMSARAAASPPTGGGQAVTGDCEPEVCYQLGIQKAAEGSYATARFAFEGLMRSHADHALAPDAQYQIAETYYLERDFARAMTELEKVPQQWPGSPRAAEALFRAGVIAQEQNDRPKARQYYQQVIQRYPQSDVRRQAEERLRAIR